MKIPFRRISREGQAFRLMHERVEIEGTIKAHRPGLLLLEACMKGPLEVDCYRCGASFAIMLDEKVAFLLSEGVFRGQDDAYDVVEVHEDPIDLDAVFDSEIALIESDYHCCDSCNH